MESTVFRTVFISDVHLGSRACRVGLLQDFLRRTRCETLYLVGDIIDLESLRRSFY
jgi:UDP-2,3-diacylglucosamine pyrophosphatase LpxH